jgi:hypothetical protein
MAEMRSMVASMKGSLSGPSLRKPLDELMEKTPVLISFRSHFGRRN